MKTFNEDYKAGLQRGRDLVVELLHTDYRGLTVEQAVARITRSIDADFASKRRDFR